MFSFFGTAAHDFSSAVYIGNPYSDGRGDGQRHNMQTARYFSGPSEVEYRLPAEAGEFADVLCKPPDVDNRMAGKDIWNSMGQMTGQAFSGPLVQLQFKIECLPISSRKAKLYIKRSISGITEQCLEKSIRAIGRE